MHALQDFLRSSDGLGLTQRQAQVLELIAKRRTLKEIAADLQISESAINQHVRAIKATLGVNSLSGLADIWQTHTTEKERHNYRNSASRISGLSSIDGLTQDQGQDEIEPVAAFQDPLSYRLEAPWEGEREHEIAPGVLNGTNAVWVRAAVIVALTIGLFAAVIVGLGAAQGVSEALTARASASRTR